jgi:hypothetical protein
LFEVLRICTMNDYAELSRNKISDLSCEVLMRFKYFHVRLSLTKCVSFHHMSSAAVGTEVTSGECFSICVFQPSESI